MHVAAAPSSAAVPWPRTNRLPRASDGQQRLASDARCPETTACVNVAANPNARSPPAQGT
eukprot:9314874-Pyramimonas_sp.AAC.1